MFTTCIPGFEYIPAVLFTKDSESQASSSTNGKSDVKPLVNEDLVHPNKIRGLVSDKEEDALEIPMEDPSSNKAATTLGSIYDPLGTVPPTTVKGKKANLQECF